MKYLFLDVDNTLLDFDGYVRACMKDGFGHFGLRPYEPWMYDVFTRENNQLWRQIERGELDMKGLEKIRWNLIFGLLGIDFDGPAFEKYFRAYLNESAIPVPGALELLQALAPHFTLCAASNGPEWQQKHRLELAGMRQYFSYCFISEALGVSKPAPEFFDRAFAILNADSPEPIRPEDCLILGDSLTSDMAGGRAYGMKTLWYRREPGKQPDVPPDYIADSLEAAEGILMALREN